MKIIITLQSLDGSYDEVGMRNRALFKTADVPRGVKAAKVYAQGKRHRIEFFHDDSIYRGPFATTYMTGGAL